MEVDQIRVLLPARIRHDLRAIHKAEPTKLLHILFAYNAAIAGERVARGKTREQQRETREARHVLLVRGDETHGRESDQHRGQNGECGGEARAVSGGHHIATDRSLARWSYPPKRFFCIDMLGLNWNERRLFLRLDFGREVTHSGRANLQDAGQTHRV